MLQSTLALTIFSLPLFPSRNAIAEVSDDRVFFTTRPACLSALEIWKLGICRAHLAAAL